MTPLKHIFIFLSFFASLSVQGADSDTVNELCFKPYPIKNNQDLGLCLKHFQKIAPFCPRNMEMIGAETEKAKCEERIIKALSLKKSLKSSYEVYSSFSKKIISFYGNGGSQGSYCSAILYQVINNSWLKLLENKDASTFSSEYRPQKVLPESFKAFIKEHFNQTAKSICHGKEHLLPKKITPKQCIQYLTAYTTDQIGNWSFQNEPDLCANWWDQDFSKTSTSTGAL